MQTGMRIWKGWGMVPENRYPMPGPNVTWPIPEATNLDEIAKYNCSPVYSRVQNLADTMTCIASGFPVAASFYINPPYWREAKHGQIQLSSHPVDSAHCIFFHGYSQFDQVLNFQNSWGVRWGDEGHGTMAFDYFERYLQEAYILLPGLGSPVSRSPINAFATDLPLGHFDCLELWDVPQKTKAAWTIIRIDGDKIEIEDLFVKPAYRRRGMATKLVLPILDMARDLQVPVTSWISLADTIPPRANISSINALCNRLGFRVIAAAVGWARYQAVTHTTSRSVELICPEDLPAPSGSPDVFASIFHEFNPKDNTFSERPSD